MTQKTSIDEQCNANGDITIGTKGRIVGIIYSLSSYSVGLGNFSYGPAASARYISLRLVRSYGLPICVFSNKTRSQECWMSFFQLPNIVLMTGLRLGRGLGE